MLDTLGVEQARITTAIDVSDHVAAKRLAIEAHRSQATDSAFFLNMPPAMFATAFGTEWYVRVGMEPTGVWEESLLDGSADAA